MESGPAITHPHCLGDEAQVPVSEHPFLLGEVVLDWEGILPAG